jgi:hypothetical protein
MIQRKQTLFLFQLIFLGIALLFVPCAHVIANGISQPVVLVPLEQQSFHSTGGHMAAIGLNFVMLVISAITVFLYKRRELHVKLCYLLAALWLVLTLMLAFCPFIITDAPSETVETNYFASLIGAFATVAAILAARHVKKDIELIKSADRIR